MIAGSAGVLHNSLLTTKSPLWAGCFMVTTLRIAAALIMAGMAFAIFPTGFEALTTPVLIRLLLASSVLVGGFLFVRDMFY